MSTLFPTNPPTPTGSDDPSTPTGYKFDDSKTIRTISIVIASFSFIVFWVLLFFLLYKNKKKIMLTYYKPQLLVITLFIFAASLTSAIIESQYDPQDPQSGITLNNHRNNQYFVYSLVGLVVAFWVFYNVCNRKNAPRSPIVWSWLYFGSMLGVVFFTMFAISSGNYSLKNKETKPGLVFGIVMFIYAIAAIGFSLNFRNYKHMLQTSGSLLFVGSVVLMALTDSSPDTRFKMIYNNIWYKDDSYISTPLVSNSTEIDWKSTNSIKMNFIVDLGSLGSTETLAKCGEDWNITYNSENQTINFNYGNETLSYPIEGNFESINVSNVTPLPSINTNTTLGNQRLTTCLGRCNNVCINSPSPIVCQSECKLAKCYRNNPQAGIISVLALTVNVENINNNSSVIIYNHKQNNSDINTMSMFLKNVTPPEKWNNVVEIQRQGTMRNFYINQKKHSGFEELDLGYKITFILSMSVIVYLVIVHFIHPNVRETLVGYRISNYWISSGLER